MRVGFTQDANQLASLLGVVGREVGVRSTLHAGTLEERCQRTADDTNGQDPHSRTTDPVDVVLAIVREIIVLQTQPLATHTS